MAPLNRTRCSCGGPEVPLNSGDCGNNRGGRGPAPLIPEAGGTRASSGLHRCQLTRVLEDPVSASVPFKSGPQCPVRILVGLHSSWAVSLCHPHHLCHYFCTSAPDLVNCLIRASCLVSENVRLQSHDSSPALTSMPSTCRDPGTWCKTHLLARH